MMNDTCYAIIKIGGSLVTKKDLTIKYSALSDIVVDIKDINKNIIVVHGGGHFTKSIFIENSHSSDFIREENNNIVKLFSERVSTVHTTILDQFKINNLNCMSIKTSSLVESNNGLIVDSDLSPIYSSLDNQQIPILYGDIIKDHTHGYYACSSDNIVSYLSKNIKPLNVVFITNVNGVYTKFPPDNGIDKYLRVLKRIEIYKMEKQNYMAGESDMYGKVLYAMECLSNTENCYIINGNIKRNLYNLLTEGAYVGTKIVE